MISILIIVLIVCAVAVISMISNNRPRYANIPNKLEENAKIINIETRAEMYEKWAVNHKGVENLITYIDFSDGFRCYFYSHKSKLRSYGRWAKYELYIDDELKEKMCKKAIKLHSKLYNEYKDIQ